MGRQLTQGVVSTQGPLRQLELKPLGIVEANIGHAPQSYPTAR